MNASLLVICIVITIILVGGLVWLADEHKKLKRDFQILSENVWRNNQDIGGLSSAAVFVDNHISRNKTELKSVIEKMDSFEEVLNSPEVSVDESYQPVIQTVLNKVDSGKEIQQSGASREETELLMRLRAMDKAGFR